MLKLIVFFSLLTVIITHLLASAQREGTSSKASRVFLSLFFRFRASFRE